MCGTGCSVGYRLGPDGFREHRTYADCTPNAIICSVCLLAGLWYSAGAAVNYSPALLMDAQYAYPQMQARIDEEIEALATANGANCALNASAADWRATFADVPFDVLSRDLGSTSSVWRCLKEVTLRWVLCPVSVHHGASTTNGQVFAGGYILENSSNLSGPGEPFNPADWCSDFLAANPWPNVQLLAPGTPQPDADLFDPAAADAPWSCGEFGTVQCFTHDPDVITFGSWCEAPAPGSYTCTHVYDPRVPSLGRSFGPTIADLFHTSTSISAHTKSDVLDKVDECMVPLDEAVDMPCSIDEEEQVRLGALQDMITNLNHTSHTLESDAFFSRLAGLGLIAISLCSLCCSGFCIWISIRGCMRCFPKNQQHGQQDTRLLQAE